MSQMQAGFATIMGGSGSVMPAIPPPPPPFYPAPMVFPYGVATDRLQICPDFMMDQCDIVLCPLVHPGMSWRHTVIITVFLWSDTTSAIYFTVLVRLLFKDGGYFVWKSADSNDGWIRHMWAIQLGLVLLDAGSSTAASQSCCQLWKQVLELEQA